jgi:CheY-like chemotaxis protein
MIGEAGCIAFIMPVEPGRSLAAVGFGWSGFAIGVVVGAVTVYALMRWLHGRERRSATRSDDASVNPSTAPPLRPTAELVGAWVHFLRDHVRDAIGGLNNRLSAIALEVEVLRRSSLDATQKAPIDGIALEVDRASNITASLMSRVSSDAPDTPPAAWGILRDAPKRPARVLVVEADESNRVAIARLLRSIGHQVSTAANGREAWESLEREPVDCVVCDPRLPSVGGRALFEQVGERLPQLTRRFVFVTADLTDPGTHEFLAESGQPVIGKPYELEDLLQGIATILQRAGS